MPEPYDSLTPYRLLPDPWERAGGIPLDGLLERTGRPGPRAARWRVLQAMGVLAFAFVLFQALSLLVAVLLLLADGIPQAQLLKELSTNLTDHLTALMVGNTFGQVLGLALPAVLLAGLHASRRGAFLRWRAGDARLIVLSVLGLGALLPVVQWLGYLNSLLPLPDWVKVLEQSQMQLIEQVLAADTGMVFNLVVLALTPAFCEEVLFRGYVQRQAERSLGAAGGILFSGLLFGLYHLRLTQVLPLAVLGLYLGYLVWRTGSLWPAIVVHFANNAFAIFLEAFVTVEPEHALPEIEQLDIPWYFVVGGALFFGAFVWALERTARMLLAHRTAGVPRSASFDYEHNRYE